MLFRSSLCLLECLPVPFALFDFALVERGVYDLGFSFFSFHSADRPTPDTLTTLKRTPGISPLALPLRPKPASRTSSFSSTKFKQPSLGTMKNVSLTRPSFLVASRVRRTEGSDLLAVLDELDTDTLSNGGVGLLGLDTDLLEDDALGVGRTSERRGLIGGTEGTLLVGEIGPFLVLSVRSQLTGGVKTTGFASSHFCLRLLLVDCRCEMCESEGEKNERLVSERRS